MSAKGYILKNDSFLCSNTSKRSFKSQRRVCRAVCSSQKSGDGPSATDRRELLSRFAGALILGTGMSSANQANAKMVDKKISGSSLSAFQRRDLLADFQMRAENEMKKVLTAAEAPTAMRLLLHDAATYDVMTKSGGVNGSIITSEELNRPVNKDLKSFVGKLAKVRESIKANGPESQKMLSWADTVVLAAKVTTELSWRQAKASKSEKSLELAEKFGNPFDIKIGRVDSDSPDADSGIPPAGSSPAEVQKFMSSLNVKDPSELGGPLSKKAPFWERPTFLLWTAAQEIPAASEEQFGAEPEYAEWKKKYDQSRSTTFRQDYEIDFVTFFNKLADLGAKFDKNAYLYDIIIQVPDRF